MEGLNICETKCCGCSACMSVCPKSAITMKENEKGFLYPEVDKKLCVDCGLCQKVCNRETEKNSIKISDIVKTKNDEQHMISQSGGAFTAISDAVLDDGGVVFGVIADENFEGVFSIAKNKEEREAMHRSKYMQARVGYIYRAVEQALEKQKVLFTGTPCQIGALKNYLQLKQVCTDNLYTVDFVCHGVPSVLIWRGIMKEVQKKVGKIQYAVWRDKTYDGWGTSNSSFFGREKYTTNHFLKIFSTNLCLRESCYECRYTSTDRSGDITIGDAWGVKEKNPDFADSRGVSLMLINSAKGAELFNAFENGIDYQIVDIENYLQRNMKEPSNPNRSISEFWNDYFNKDFSYIIKKYGDNNIVLNFKYILKKGFNTICRRK